MVSWILFHVVAYLQSVLFGSAFEQVRFIPRIQIINDLLSVNWKMLS